MNDIILLFDLIRNNIKMAQRDFHNADPDGFDYFLARLSLNISKMRSLYGRKPCECTESSE